MGFASLNSTLISRCSRTAHHPSDPRETVKAPQSVAEAVTDLFALPYTQKDMKKVTVRIDERLLAAFKIQAILRGQSQQSLFREAIERQLLSTDWLKK
ncbi:hypothetical protein QGN29_02855 [Temperatibacter marinus]|uniref:Uncharacterized protein n=1 Tax=Temperatibacter marinus TaxID=1456591 RepID=A0AA52HB60_9PROT|nr:hypothetical protein [Temperatibacter marinus]WND03308.1 hypothetical protein QGN29_02855 [Temperatibacter marinus]